MVQVVGRVVQVVVLAVCLGNRLSFRERQVNEVLGGCLSLHWGAVCWQCLAKVVLEAAQRRLGKRKNAHCYDCNFCPVVFYYDCAHHIRSTRVYC